MDSSNKNSGLVISYFMMRRIIGILGIGLPVIVVLGGFLQNGFVFRDSISSYYYTNMRDFFVGLLCCVGLFLMSHKGYEKIDNITGSISGIFALGIAFFPTYLTGSKIIDVGIFQLSDNVSAYFHLTFATLFFLSMAFISIFLFTRHGATKTKQKEKRNIVYITCGYVIIASIVCMLVYDLFMQNTFITSVQPVLIFETISLSAFGISWLVKGETLFADKDGVEE
jgi:uncharacterized membrane protein YozB (DUF420 family)